MENSCLKKTNKNNPKFLVRKTKVTSYWPWKFKCFKIQQNHYRKLHAIDTKHKITKSRRFAYNRLCFWYLHKKTESKEIKLKTINVRENFICKYQRVASKNIIKIRWRRQSAKLTINKIIFFFVFWRKKKPLQFFAQFLPKTHTLESHFIGRNSKLNYRNKLK